MWEIFCECGINFKSVDCKITLKTKVNFFIIQIPSKPEHFLIFDDFLLLFEMLKKQKKRRPTIMRVCYFCSAHATHIQFCIDETVRWVAFYVAHSLLLPD